jgi:hypothetical protein
MVEEVAYRWTVGHEQQRGSVHQVHPRAYTFLSPVVPRIAKCSANATTVAAAAGELLLRSSLFPFLFERIVSTAAMARITSYRGCRPGPPTSP